MERDDKTLFRITAWPDTRLPVPERMLNAPLDLVDDEVFVLNMQREEELAFAPTPQELYLELIAVPNLDQEAAREFARRYSITGLWLTGAGGALGLGWSTFEENLFSRLLAERERLEVPGEDGGFEETLLEFWAAAGWVHDLTMAWRVVQGEIEAADVAWRGHAHGASRPADLQTAAAFLATGLTDSLRWVHPAIRVSRPDQPGDLSDPRPRLAIGSLEFTVYRICLLQLYNHIVEGAIYRECANETCDRIFVRQEGRAEHGQYRTTGVKYHSPECARAQAQRQYRRRKASGT